MSSILGLPKKNFKTTRPAELAAGWSRARSTRASAATLTLALLATEGLPKTTTRISRSSTRKARATSNRLETKITTRIKASEFPISSTRLSRAATGTIKDSTSPTTRDSKTDSRSQTTKATTETQVGKLTIRTTITTVPISTQTTAWSKSMLSKLPRRQLTSPQSLKSSHSLYRLPQLYKRRLLPPRFLLLPLQALCVKSMRCARTLEKRARANTGTGASLPTEIMSSRNEGHLSRNQLLKRSQSKAH